jgi:hypothetical protein
MIKCKKCGFEHKNESDVDLHHIIPKVLEGTDRDGIVYLCGTNKGNDCHRKLHKFLRKDSEIKELLKRKFGEWIDNTEKSD